jgi:hypothetical protein
VKGLNKLFLRLCIVNLVLLLAYSIASYFEWNRLLELPLVVAVKWSPFNIQTWFGGTVPVIIDGLFWEINWSYAIMLVTIIFNLGMTRMILKKNP